MSLTTLTLFPGSFSNDASDLRRNNANFGVHFQFFITSSGDHRDVKNGVGQALLQRISKAHK